MDMVQEKKNLNNNIINSKICGVCGDKALGHNFNAVTCESCKAFFRRNALTTKSLRCPFNGNCEITVIKRRFCQKCRLDKCFAIGMRKDCIMSEEDKVIKRQKIEMNRAKKRLSLNNANDNDVAMKIKRETFNSDESCDEYHNSLSNSPNLLNNIQNSPINVVNPQMANDRVSTLSTQSSNSNGIIKNGVTYQVIEMTSDNSNSGSVMNENTVLAIDNSSKASISSGQCNEVSLLSELIGNNVQCRNQTSHSKPTIEDTVNMVDVTRDVMQEVQRQERVTVEHNSIESILCEAIKLEFEAYTAIAPPHTSNSRELNDAERAKLNELIVANKALLQPVDDDIRYITEDEQFMPLSSSGTISGSNNSKDPALLDVINLTAIAIRRLIKMAKKINAFKNMCQEDQVALLKGGCTEMMILRSAMTYDQTKDSWKIPHSQESLSRIKVDVLKQARGNIYQEHERFIKTFDPRWRMDENIILIMCAITLFTPDRSRVIHQDVIKLEQNSYYYLLRRYLESIYQGCEAKSTFLKLIQKISELHKLNGEVINVYLDVNPAGVEPLLIELFDLKPH